MVGLTRLLARYISEAALSYVITVAFGILDIPFCIVCDKQKHIHQKQRCVVIGMVGGRC